MPKVTKQHVIDGLKKELKEAAEAHDGRVIILKAKIVALANRLHSETARANTATECATELANPYQSECSRIATLELLSVLQGAVPE